MFYVLLHNTKWCIWCKGSTVMQWLALFLRSKKVQAWTWWPAGAFLLVVCKFLLCLCGFFPPKTCRWAQLAPLYCPQVWMWVWKFFILFFLCLCQPCNGFWPTLGLHRFSPKYCLGLAPAPLWPWMMSSIDNGWMFGIKRHISKKTHIASRMKNGDDSSIKT